MSQVLMMSFMTVHMVFFMSEFSSSKIFQDNFDGTLSLSFSVVGSGENNLQKAYRFRTSAPFVVRIGL